MCECVISTLEIFPVNDQNEYSCSPGHLYSHDFVLNLI